MIEDVQNQERVYQLPEIQHHYGPNVHLLNDPFLFSLLAQVSRPECTQPLLDAHLHALYTGLLHYVVNAEFPKKRQTVQTRMAETHAEGNFSAELVDPATRAVCVSLARAGILPSHTCFGALNHCLPPAHVRQDHVSINRRIDQNEQVVGTMLGGVKIGGTVEKSFVLIPDPMGATGSTVCSTLELYRLYGEAKRFIAMHLIVSPEYLMTVQKRFPELRVYALRLDRGLSEAAVLETVPGTHWERERGLNHKQYIVPGAGGLGELINNTDV